MRRRACESSGPRRHGAQLQSNRSLYLSELCNDPQMIAAFSVTPIGVGESVSQWVADAVQIVRDSGLPNETNAMFTNLEGDWDEVMAVIKACLMKVGEGSPRVSLVVKVDYRPGITDAIHSKVQAIDRRLS